MPAPSSEEALKVDELRKIDAYWRACNYLCAGMIYLRDNPLLREPLRPEHFKNRLLGHWGSDPGQTFAWVHLNRVIRKYDLDMIYISGPRPWRTGGDLELLSGRDLFGDLSGEEPGRSGYAQAVPRLLLSRASSGAIARRRFPGRSMRAASWATACRMRSERRSTIPI